MFKITVFFQYVVVFLLLVGATVFLLQQKYLQTAVYGALGALFLIYSYLENKNQKKQEKI